MLYGPYNRYFKQIQKDKQRWYYSAEQLYELRNDIHKESGSEAFWHSIEAAVQNRRTHIQNRLHSRRNNPNPTQSAEYYPDQSGGWQHGLPPPGANYPYYGQEGHVPPMGPQADPHMYPNMGHGTPLTPPMTPLHSNQPPNTQTGPQNVQHGPQMNMQNRTVPPNHQYMNMTHQQYPPQQGVADSGKSIFLKIYHYFPLGGMENMDIFQNIPDPAMNYDGGYGDIQGKSCKT